MKLGYIILYVPDVAAAMQFYKDAFGFAEKFVHEDGDYGEIESGSTTLAFATFSLIDAHGFDYQKVKSDSPAPGMEIGFICDNVQTCMDAALLHGAVVVSPAEKKPWGQTVGYVRDPNGF